MEGGQPGRWAIRQVGIGPSGQVGIRPGGQKDKLPLARWATRQMLMKQLGSGTVGQWARWAPDQKGKKLSMAVGQVCKKAIEQWAK